MLDVRNQLLNRIAHQPRLLKREGAQRSLDLHVTPRTDTYNIKTVDIVNEYFK